MSTLGVGEKRVGAVPSIRIRQVNSAHVRADGEFVLYWMIASRRVHSNFALDRAVEHCVALRKPLVIFEALRCGYPWASDRMHRFAIDGMAENARECEANGICYYAYVEPIVGAGRGLLEALAEKACVVVTDEYPCFFLPRMVESAGQRLPVALEAVDSNGLLPIYACEKVMGRAFDLRRFLQKELPKHLPESPQEDPLGKLKSPQAVQLPVKMRKHWAAASQALLSGNGRELSFLPIDHGVPRVELCGGHAKARAQMREFFERKLTVYADERSEPDCDVGSGLSPFLHFGHLSVHEVFAELARREKWDLERISLQGKGSRAGWWNMSRNAETFLDEIITWRELGFNFSSHRADYDRYESLPEWARMTLQEHARDEREYGYTLQQFERAQSHDPLWNASQRQLLREGKIHNYLRMLWGKKILQWTRTPQEAMEIMIQLNNKYALDGRDPNSYSGIFWVLGRYDRPWAPVRPVFGSIRYMSSENTARKLSVKKYIKKYSAKATTQTQPAP